MEISLASEETSVSPFAVSCLAIASLSSSVPASMKTVALRPESFTLVTPDCAVKTELVFCPMPQPFPDTVTMYTGSF